jgi:hypothetical protein
MKFWKKYKAKKKLEKEKKELREKLEKARFVNFYGEEIDLSLGRIKQLIHYNKTTTISSNFYEDEEDYDYSIILKYDNFKERYLSYGQAKSIRDARIYELNSFANSDKFTERLNEYENLKEEYEQL